MIDLKKFCHPTGLKEMGHLIFREPYFHNGHRYATNGHLFIRVDNTAADESDFIPHLSREISAIKSMETMLSIELGTVYEIPEQIEIHPCNECAGTGKLKLIQCEDCDGLGSFTRGQHTYDCLNCDGDGELHVPGSDEHCYCCHGTKIHPDPAAVIGGSAFNPGYLLMIKDLPNVKIHVTEGRYLAPAVFTFDGGIGAIMPMRTHFDQRMEDPAG